MTYGDREDQETNVGLMHRQPYSQCSAATTSNFMISWLKILRSGHLMLRISEFNPDDDLHRLVRRCGSRWISNNNDPLFACHGRFDG
jgi:hypothetical protein